MVQAVFEKTKKKKERERKREREREKERDVYALCPLFLPTIPWVVTAQLQWQKHVICWDNFVAVLCFIQGMKEREVGEEAETVRREKEELSGNLRKLGHFGDTIKIIYLKVSANITPKM